MDVEHVRNTVDSHRRDCSQERKANFWKVAAFLGVANVGALYGIYQKSLAVVEREATAIAQAETANIVGRSLADSLADQTNALARSMDMVTKANQAMAENLILTLTKDLEQARINVSNQVASVEELLWSLEADPGVLEDAVALLRAVTTNRELADVSKQLADLRQKTESLQGTVTGVTNWQARQSEEWHRINLKPPWKSHADRYDEPAYFKSGPGIVFLRGVIDGGKEDSDIFQLPRDYWPPRRVAHVALSENDLGRVDIEADGTVRCKAGKKGWLSLDGISFRAALHE